jgi:hypothetical protein
LVLSAAINWKVMAWYLACMAALTIAFPQPSYDGPENVTYMRDAVFRDLVLRPFVLPSYYFFFSSSSLFCFHSATFASLDPLLGCLS